VIGGICDPADHIFFTRLIFRKRTRLGNLWYTPDHRATVGDTVTARAC
jgi:hypothetical protein